MHCLRQSAKTILYFLLCCFTLHASPALAQWVAREPGNICGSQQGSDYSIQGQAWGPDSTGNLATTGNNLICDGSHWQYPALIAGNIGAGGTAASCVTGTAGAIEWTGSALQYCNGTSWTAMGGGGLSGGTTNYEARWTSSTALGIGAVYDNGTSVGIGTATPGFMLEVVGSATNTNIAPFVALEPSLATGYEEYLNLGVANASNNWASMGFYYAGNGSTSNRMDFVFNGESPAISILAGGNVGIGTTGPGYPLDIQGTTNQTLNVQSNNTAATSIDVNNTSTNGHNWQISSTGSLNGNGPGSLAFYDATVPQTRLIINTSGNVGIGTTSPSAPLHVKYASANSNAGTPALILDNPSGGTQSVMNFDINGTQEGGIRADSVGNMAVNAGSNALYLNFNSGTGGIYFGNGAGGTTGIITSAGSVGIGTTSPQSMVHAYNGEVQVGSSGASCTSSNAGAMRYSSGSMYYCNGSAWTFFNSCSQVLPYVNTNGSGGGYGSYSANTNPSQGMWGDGTYLYSGSGGSSIDLEAFSFNNSTHVWTNVAHTTPAGFITIYVGNIWGDGTYIYLPEGTTGIQAYSFNGTSFTSKGTYTTTMSANWIWGNGTNIFVADGTHGVKAFTFNGTTFTLKATKTGPQALNVWGDGTYIYVTDNSGDNLYAYTFSGTTWTQKGTINVGGGEPGALWGDGTYIYVANGGAVEAYTFNGTTFTLKGTFNTPGWGPDAIWGKNGNIYIAGNGIEVVSFNGTSFTYKGSIVENSYSSSLWADANNVYFTDATGEYIAAYPLCN
jgi:hypothetical protein